MNRLYGAYGSNLNQNQMRHRCPDAEVYGTAELADWQLVFKKSGTGAYLSIEPCKGSMVPLGIWTISDDDEEALDHYEGFPRFYRKELMTVPVVHDGEIKNQEVMVYIMNEDRPLGCPSMTYYETCQEGYEDFWFDQNILIDSALQAGLPLQKLVEDAQLLTCPECGRKYTGRPALSRKDSKTLICPRCGSREAMEAIGMPEDEIQKVLDRMEKAGGFDWNGSDDY